MFNYKIIYTVFIFFILSCSDIKIIPDYEKFTAEIGELNYRILYPKNFDESKKYPLTLFVMEIFSVPLHLYRLYWKMPSM